MVPIRSILSRLYLLAFLQTGYLFKLRLRTAAEDACRRLQKNFSAQELSYVRNRGLKSPAKGMQRSILRTRRLRHT